MSHDSEQREAAWTIRAGEDLGLAIAEIRSRRGLTQRQLAEESGLSRDYLAQIEAGRTGRLLEHMLRVLRRCGAELTITHAGGHGQG